MSINSLNIKRKKKKKMEYKNLGDHINIADDRYCCNVLLKLLPIIRRSRFYYDRRYRFGKRQNGYS